MLLLRFVLCAAAVLAFGVAVSGRGPAQSAYPGVHPKPLFATPGQAAYCSVQASSQDDLSPALFCWTPNDGFAVMTGWNAAEVATAYYTKPPAIVHGTAVL